MTNHATSHTPAVFLFGSLIDSFSQDTLDDIRRTLRDPLSRQWVQDTADELPIYWDTLAAKMPHITDAIGAGGRQSLLDLGAWLRGDVVQLEHDLSTMVITPLAVLAQLAQYRRYLAARHTTQANIATSESRPAVLGFCMGFFSSFAIASAYSDAELATYGAVGVRLSMICGAIIDAQHIWSPSKSFATAWTTPRQRDDFQHVLDALYPEAYISVLYDETRATVVTTRRAAARLSRQLRAAGIISNEVGFRGELHSPKPEGRTHADALIALCAEEPGLQWPNVEKLALRTWANDGDAGDVNAEKVPMQEIALRAILARQCDWAGTFAAVKADVLDGNEDVAVGFGPDRVVPPSQLRKLGRRLVHFADMEESDPQSKESREHVPEQEPRGTPEEEQDQQQSRPKELPQQEHVAHNHQNAPTPTTDPNSIAVCGMAIKTAGAPDLAAFAPMLQSGLSQHEPITHSRMRFDDSLFRASDSRQYYGNFVADADAFDHKFFKRSPREAAMMDPQHRLFLQAAYQAVEQAGYFSEQTRGTRYASDRKHVGVFVGSAAMDYEDNAACYDANAYTATGCLKSFQAGRVAHHFGWTGPAISFDTACSSSAVAIHTACRNLLSGECSAALAGGVSILTNPLWFQNMAGANFLSPTGQCKPFDENGDGYCRSEAIGCVFLKRMGDAVADGNQILGSIAASAVYQNMNITPMFVPNSPSLAQLFTDVLHRAKVNPGDISLVEAHGTGTAVGDPAEWAALRQAVGGPVRTKPLPIGSSKGHVGHAEGASGIISLVKVLSMMHDGYIPPQASFVRLNPGIGATPEDRMEVVTALRAWDDEHKVALINNYGASGSNAAMVVAQSPYGRGVESAIRKVEQQRFPFLLTGLDARSIKEFAFKLAQFVKDQKQAMLADFSFNINRQANPELGHGLVFSCRSTAELEEKLTHAASASTDDGIGTMPAERPVILCFGGQVSTFVGLDRTLYDSAATLRHHLSECDAVVRSSPLQLGSIFPDIFTRTPFSDPVRLQTALFAMQYACARSWLDGGLGGKVAAVVGHSFGELTALCISGVLTLEHAIHLVASRARLVREAWGSEKGAMMAVEADEALVQELLAEAAGQHEDSPASVACYNGPRSFTLAGSTKAIDAVAKTIAGNSKFTGLKNKRLNVTNAFHSSLVDPLMDRLEQVGQQLIFHAPTIPVERATETSFSGPFTAQFVPEHMRHPVFFNHALQRLAKQHPSAVFLEAGSSSTITVMASRALGQTGSHHFQALNLTNDKGVDGLADATAQLWRQGVRVAFWPQTARQTTEYASLLLPQYQFEKTRHWINMRSNVEAAGQAQGRIVETAPEAAGLFSFLGYQDSAHSRLRFRVNTGSERYKTLVAGHIVANTAPICPATVQLDMAIEALYSVHPAWKTTGLQPVMHDIVNHIALCVDPSRSVFIDFTAGNGDQTLWEWRIVSADSTSAAPHTHVEGRLHIRAPDDATYQAEFARFERLVSYTQCAALLAAAGRDENPDVLQGRNVYRAFNEVVDYADMYRGVRSVVGLGSECAGRVHHRHAGDVWPDAVMHDCFAQVSGLWVNCMTDHDAGDIFIANGIEMVMRAPKNDLQPGQTQDIWHAYTRSTKLDDSAYLVDLFVFNASSGELVEVMLGIHYSRVAKVSMSRMLTKLTKDKSVMAVEAVPVTQSVVEAPKRQDPKKADGVSAADQARKVVATVAGMEVAEVSLDTQLADIGIDSLMGMELCREVNEVFHCALDQAKLLQARDVREIISLIGGTGAMVSDADDDDAKDSASVSSWSSDSQGDGYNTPMTPPATGSATPIPKAARDLDVSGTEARPDKQMRDIAAREAEAEKFVAQYTAGWDAPALASTPVPKGSIDKAVVVITGATGSLGSHLVAAFANSRSVANVVCVNRHNSNSPVDARQADAFTKRGIVLSPAAKAKLRCLATDTSRPQLGLDPSEYAWLAAHGTHIVHNAWPMSVSRGVAAFEPQFQTMRNLLDLAREMATRGDARVGFQLVTSISVVGQAGMPRVPEDRVRMASVIPIGYAEGKWVCERMLDETLHKHAGHFRTMTVRPGQIAGSSTSGFWNPMEHFCFLVKSAQSLRAWPDLPRVLQWTPVDVAAQSMADLMYIGAEALAPQPYPVYHIDNPVGQPWKAMSAVLADALGVDEIVPYREWLRRVADARLPETENPAVRILDFFENHFERMDCGGLVLETTKTQEHSETLKALGPVSDEVARSYVREWKKMGFLAA